MIQSHNSQASTMWMPSPHSLQRLHWVSFMHPPLASCYPVTRSPQWHRHWAAKGSEDQEMNADVMGRPASLVPPAPLSGVALGNTNPPSGNVSTFLPPFGSDVVSCLERESRAPPVVLLWLLTPRCFRSPFKCHLPPCTSYRCLFFSALAFSPTSLHVNRHGKDTVHLLSKWVDLPVRALFPMPKTPSLRLSANLNLWFLPRKFRVDSSRKLSLWSL